MLFWAMLVVASIVWLVVVVAAFWRTPRAARDARGPRADRRPTAATRTAGHDGVSSPGWWRQRRLISCSSSCTTSRSVARSPNAERALTIELIGHQWWWEVQYIDPDPSKIVVDANELHIPAGEPVQMKLRVARRHPQLLGAEHHRQARLIPGLHVVALSRRPPASTARSAPSSAVCSTRRWRSRGRASARGVRRLARATARAGRRAKRLERRCRGSRSSSRGCALCHAIAGTPAYGTVGPDLTHLASRTTLAAGTLAQHARATSRGWIVDPQSIKPGVRMPANQLEPRTSTRCSRIWRRSSDEHAASTLPAATTPRSADAMRASCRARSSTRTWRDRRGFWGWLHRSTTSDRQALHRHRVPDVPRRRHRGRDDAHAARASRKHLLGPDRYNQIFTRTARR